MDGNHVRAPAVDALEDKLRDDPWSLDATERRLVLRLHQDGQNRWLDVLRTLVEPPAPAETFPAFLLDVTPFDRLRDAIGTARSPRDLDTATADELQRFVDHYRDYLAAEHAPSGSPSTRG
jgi:hypothetical protein